MKPAPGLMPAGFAPTELVGRYERGQNPVLAPRSNLISVNKGGSSLRPIRGQGCPAPQDIR